MYQEGQILVYGFYSRKGEFDDRLLRFMILEYGGIVASEPRVLAGQIEMRSPFCEHLLFLFPFFLFCFPTNDVLVQRTSLAVLKSSSLATAQQAH